MSFARKEWQARLRTLTGGTRRGERTVAFTGGQHAQRVSSRLRTLARGARRGPGVDGRPFRLLLVSVSVPCPARGSMAARFDCFSCPYPSLVLHAGRQPPRSAAGVRGVACRPPPRERRPPPTVKLRTNQTAVSVMLSPIPPPFVSSGRETRVIEAPPPRPSRSSESLAVR